MSRVILFLRSSRQCTGLERRMALIADAARRAGFHPHVAAFGRDSERTGALHPLIACATEAGLAGECIPDPSPFSLSAWRSLRAVIARLRPAIIHCNDYRSDVLALLASRGTDGRPRLIATSHGHTAADLKLRLYEALDRQALTRFDRVIGVSRHQCEILRTWGLAEEQIVHIPHAVEPGWGANVSPEARAAWRQALEVHESDILIGFFGRRSPEKGLATLLAAWPDTRVAFPSARLVVVGGAGPQIHHAGVHAIAHQDDIQPLLAACDLVVVPSHREAFGLVALEALAAGKPVVASCTGGLPEIVPDGLTGYLAPPADPAALATTIVNALRHWPATLEMARRGQADVWNRFPACQMLESVIALYEQLV